MDLGDFRLTVQNGLRSERGVTDVAFSPMGDAEIVHFYEGGVRAHFALIPTNYDHPRAMAILKKGLNAMAQHALTVAQEHAAIANEKRAEAV